MSTTTFRSAIRYPRAAQPRSLTPRQVAAAYNFPISTATGKGCTLGIIELGGGYSPAQVARYFTDNQLPAPKFTAVSVAGGKNKQDGPDGADGEVQLDMIVAGAVAPGAEYRVYFCPNTDSGFLAGIKQATTECDAVSISWGGPESSWDPATMDKFEAVLGAARAAGVPVFVASGDTGSQDSSGAGNQADFPASAPSAVGCGGTRLTISAVGARDAEVVWNDNPTSSATGGGPSKHYPGRGVPDIAGNADPDTGYEVYVDGQLMVVGGTSAVAPLMLGLHALLLESCGHKRFDFGNLCTTNPQAFFDVTSGNNGAYRAGPGRDYTTGLGVPDGAKLLAALTGGVAPPAPPAPVPAPQPTPATDPMADFPVTVVATWGNHKHNHSAIEAAAYKGLQAWAASHGLSLPA